MTPRPLPELASLLGGTMEAAAGAEVAGGTAVAVTGITHASSEIRPGDLFAALPGAQRHGSVYVADAAARGAVAVLSDAAGVTDLLPTLVVDDPRARLGEAAAAIYGDPTRTLPVLGITGTAGKTSTAYLIDSGLRAAGHRTALIGTVETRLGELVLDSARTTPEATDLQALLAAAREDGVTAVAMEVSSHALAMGRVSGTRFAVGGYTNFGLDHLDFHADADDYFAAKAKLFDGRCRVEIINGDEPALRVLIREHTVTYSASGDPGATWRAVDVTGQGYAQRFRALGPGGVAVDTAVALPGRHNIANALLAIASLVAIGVPPEVAAKGVADCPGVPGRLERVDAPGEILGVVDYAHKPDAIVAALRALRDITAGRLICVIGAGGDRDRGKRPLMGAAAAQGADLVVVTDDNPRTEDAAAIRAQVRAGAEETGSAEVIEVAGRRAAIAEAVARARSGDVVALLGKGHERGQEVAGQVHPFDDRVELSVALSAGSDR